MKTSLYLKRRVHISLFNIESAKSRSLRGNLGYVSVVRGLRGSVGTWVACFKFLRKLFGLHGSK